VCQLLGKGGLNTGNILTTLSVITERRDEPNQKESEPICSKISKIRERGSAREPLNVCLQLAKGGEVRGGGEATEKKISILNGTKKVIDRNQRYGKY